jgi:hypothetical protein
MSDEVHRVVQHPQHQNPLFVELVDQKVTGTADQAAPAFRSRATVAEVIGARPRAKLRPIQTAEAAGVGPQVVKRDVNNGLISAPRLDAEDLLAMTKDGREIALGEQGQVNCAQSVSQRWPVRPRLRR